MPETLLSPSSVLLFGRRVTDLEVTAQPHNPSVAARYGNTLLEAQVARNHAANAPDQTVFARIYGFSYEGTYYDLPRPLLFLVHGPGQPAEQAPAGPGNARFARAPDSPDRTGIAAADFSFGDQVMVWSYDKDDFTIRMEVDTGTFEDTLLAPFFLGEGYGVSGAKVSGAKVSGAKLSGARIAGAKVSGAKLWGGRGDASD